jgi:Tfp pilus assembly protein PilV
MKHIIIIKNIGFSLVEVLISLTVISFGLLGLLDAQLVAMADNHNIYLQKCAINQINTLAEQLRADSSASARNQTILSWQNNIKKMFPEGSTDVIQDNSIYRVTIKWSEDRQITTTTNRSMSENIYI